MKDLPLRLNCTQCKTFTMYERDGTMVECMVCGKHHSRSSLFVVHPDKNYDRDEAGILLEEPP